MATRPGQKIKMTSIDELLCVPETEGTTELDIRAIYPFENHPFKVLDDEKMEELVDSIKANGILTPVIVRPDDEGTYEMISGHRRLHAAERAGLTKIPAIIKELTDDESTILMVDANIQREEILPSEKAFAYKMKLDAVKRQAGRPKKLTKEELANNSAQVGRNLESADLVAQQVGESRMQLRRYIRLTELIPELLEWVDAKRVPLNKLTDNVYHYDAEAKVFELGEKFVEREAAKGSVEKSEEKSSVLGDLKAKKEEVAKQPKKDAVDKAVNKNKGGDAI